LSFVHHLADHEEHLLCRHLAKLPVAAAVGFLESSGSRTGQCPATGKLSQLRGSLAGFYGVTLRRMTFFDGKSRKDLFAENQCTSLEVRRPLLSRAVRRNLLAGRYCKSNSIRNRQN